MGPRNRLTLRAKTDLLRSYFTQKRFGEAYHGLLEVAQIQKDVFGEDNQDYFMTLLLLAGAEQAVTKFQLSIVTFTQASEGFGRLLGKDNIYYLVVQMSKGQSLERMAKYEEAYLLYQEILQTWVTVGDPDHPFSSMLKTSLGSACRQLRRFSESKAFLLESFAQRKKLFGNENISYIDSVLQLAALYHASQQGDEALKVLGFIESAEVLQEEFERRCQLIHIDALVKFGNRCFKTAIMNLYRILNKASGDEREKNNRELPWVRITLADALRRCRKDHEALMVFSDLVKPVADHDQCSHDDHSNQVANLHPLSLIDEPETPAQLALAEEALRLVRAAKPDEAERLLQSNGLQWQREADFWVLQGGPVTDTASISGLENLDSSYFDIDFDFDVGSQNCTDKNVWSSLKVSAWRVSLSRMLTAGPELVNFLSGPTK